jgi:hypothetical protein
MARSRPRRVAARAPAPNGDDGRDGAVAERREPVFFRLLVSDSIPHGSGIAAFAQQRRGHAWLNNGGGLQRDSLYGRGLIWMECDFRREGLGLRSTAYGFAAALIFASRAFAADPAVSAESGVAPAPKAAESADAPTPTPKADDGLIVTLPSVPMMLRQSPAGSLPLRAEVETSHGYASYH